MPLLDRFSSLHLTWWTITGLILWFVLGSLAASLPSFQAGLEGMNSLLLRSWLTSKGLEHPWTLSWLLALVLLAATLGLNLVACLWKRLRMRNGTQKLRFWIFISLHLFFGLVMLLHGLETVIGEKFPQQTVQAGDSLDLDSVWSLHIKEVSYVNDPSLLQLDKHEARRAMTRDSFDLQSNSVRIALMHKKDTVHTGDIRMLHPLHHAGFHVVLRGFVFHPQSIGATIKVVKSPLHTVFFSAYALLIASMTSCCAYSLYLQRRSVKGQDAPCSRHKTFSA